MKKQQTRDQARYEYVRQLAELLDKASEYGVKVVGVRRGHIVLDDLRVNGIEPNVEVLIDWNIQPTVVG